MTYLVSIIPAIYAINFIGIHISVYIDAAKKYHEYLVRQDKPIPEAQKGYEIIMCIFISMYLCKFQSTAV